MKKIVHHCPCGNVLPKTTAGYGIKVKVCGICSKVCEKCASRIGEDKRI